MVPDLVHRLASDRGSSRDDVPGQEDEDREGQSAPTRLQAERDLPAVAPAQDRPALLGELVGDVAAGVRGAHDEHRPLLELSRPAIVTGVKLLDRRVEIRGEGRHVRRPSKGPRGHHDVVAGERAVAERDRKPASRPALEPGNPGVHLHRKVEAERVALQEVSDLLLARVRPRLGREPQAREPVVLGRGVQAEAVPLLAPVVAHPLVPVDDEEWPPQPLQVVPGRQPRLARADHQRLDVLSAHCSSR